MKNNVDEKNKLMQIGSDAFEVIHEMVEALESATSDERDDADSNIHEDPLSVEVRSGWYAPGQEVPPPAEYCILLSTGGPATRIIGELSEDGYPTTARLEAQDWGTPWTNTHQHEETLLKYARQFYFRQ